MLKVYRSNGAGEREECAEAVTERLGDGIVRIPPSEIRLRRGAGRAAAEGDAIAPLAESIRRYGVLQPLLVRRTEEGATELISGERRLRAAEAAGLLAVPCIYTEASECESAELSVVENLRRCEMTYFEEAQALSALLTALGVSKSELARRLSVSRAYVANKLRLLGHSPRIRALLLEKGMNERQARALLRIADEEERAELILLAAEDGLGAGATEALIEKRLTEREAGRSHRRIKGAISDLRLLYNAVERAADAARRAGIPIGLARRETEEGEELILSVGANAPFTP